MKLLWVLVSLGWLCLSGFVAYQEWSNTPEAWVQRPDNWERDHPECYERFGRFEDGSRMDEATFGSFYRYQSKKGPHDHDGSDIDRWARGTFEKIRECEEPQWKSIAEATARWQNRRLLMGFAAAPQLFFLLYYLALSQSCKLVPQHVRIGLSRIYAVASCAWISWFAIRLVNGAQPMDFGLFDFASVQWRHVLLLLSFPIGTPMLFSGGAWIVAGFRSSGGDMLSSEAPQVKRRP